MAGITSTCPVSIASTTQGTRQKGEGGLAEAGNSRALIAVKRFGLRPGIDRKSGDRNPSLRSAVRLKAMGPRLAGPHSPILSKKLILVDSEGLD